jgi:hypothetical protein
MPKVSRDSAPQRQEAGPVVDLRGELDGYTVSFTSLLEDIDAAPSDLGLHFRTHGVGPCQGGVQDRPSDGAGWTAGLW